MTSTVTYSGNRTTSTNAKNQVKTETRDVWRRLWTSLDAIQKQTAYEHDAFGNLTKTTDSAGNVIAVTYDTLGRKTDLRDPDLGWIHYDVDPLGQVWQQTSPMQRPSKSTRMKYDDVGRMVQRSSFDLTAGWVYDKLDGQASCLAFKSCGQLVQSYTMAGTVKDFHREHSFDSLGRPAATTTSLDVIYTVQNEYDSWGRPVKETYQRAGGSPKVFDRRYNAYGDLARVERSGLVLWRATEKDAAGRLTKATLGNGLMIDRSYDSRTGRLMHGTLQNAQSMQLQEDYSYDKLGNVAQRTQSWPGTSFDEMFTYDGLNRLKTSAVTGYPTQIFQYDDLGNIKNKTGVGSGDYVYPASGLSSTRPHAVSSIPGLGLFNYDPNGNLKDGAGRTNTWTDFDMPSNISNGTSSRGFVYGADYQRVKQTSNDGSGLAVYYPGPMEVETRNGTVESIKTYWPLGLGVEIEKAGSTTLNWTHQDRLGSVAAISDQSGNLVEKLAYDSWGKRRTLVGDATPNSIDGQVDNKGYTGHEMLDAFDLVHMNGRVYDPFIARFMSADPIIQDPEHSQSYNRYTYVWNNPTNLTDPTGFEAVSIIPCAQRSSCTTAPSGQQYNCLLGGRAVECPKIVDWPKANESNSANNTKNNQNIQTKTASANSATSEPAFVARHPATSEIHFLAADKWDHWSEHFAERKQETGNFIYGNLSQWTGWVADNLDGIVMVAGSIRGVKGGAGKLGVPEEGFVPNAKVAGPYSRPSGAGPTAEQKASVQGKPCAECGALSKNQVADHKVPLVVQHYRDGRVNVDQQRRVDAVQPHCPSCSAQQGGYLSGFSRAMKQLFGF